MKTFKALKLHLIYIILYYIILYYIILYYIILYYIILYYIILFQVTSPALSFQAKQFVLCILCRICHE